MLEKGPIPNQRSASLKQYHHATKESSNFSLSTILQHRCSSFAVRGESRQPIGPTTSSGSLSSPTYSNHSGVVQPTFLAGSKSDDSGPSNPGRSYATSCGAGAAAYVAKQSAPQELLTALRQAVAGQTYITPLLQEAIGFAPVSELRAEDEQAAIRLTTRQREVLQLVAEGRTSRQISTSLSISTKTVEFHKKSLMNETGLRTTAELTRYAIAHGIISM